MMRFGEAGTGFSLNEITPGFYTINTVKKLYIP